MGRKLDSAHNELMAGRKLQGVKPSTSSLPKGVTRMISHKFDTSGNSLALYMIEQDGKVTFRVTTVFDGDTKTIVRDDYEPWELARKLMGRKPKQEVSDG